MNKNQFANMIGVSLAGFMLGNVVTLIECGKTGSAIASLLIATVALIMFTERAASGD